MDNFGITQALIILEVVNRHRGSDDSKTYLRKLKRTLSDMLAGRRVKEWRLDRARIFFEDLSNTCLQKSSEHRGGCF